MPGTLVESFFPVGKLDGFAYEVRTIDGHFEASTPYRPIAYVGVTREQAIGIMLHDVARLARVGHMDPDRPAEKGSPPIQHAIHILSQRLLWQVERRREHLEFSPALPDESIADEVLIKSVARDNEIVSALATSIAALARVKDL